MATLQTVFPHVALMAGPTRWPEPAAATWWRSPRAPIDVAGIAARLAQQDTGWGVITGAELDAWVDGAPVLTDDYAPVDQLLTPYTVR